GGNQELGQVWQYRPGDETLALVFESPSRHVLNRPDNVCVSPRGAVVLCEDSGASRQYLKGLTRDGRIFDIAANLASKSELAGVSFSPDGRALVFHADGERGGRRQCGYWRLGEANKRVERLRERRRYPRIVLQSLP